MNALYNNRIYNVVDVAGDITLDTDVVEAFDVSLHDPRLIVEPTDKQVADAENLAEWYGINAQAADKLRLMLRGQISIDQWEDWKAAGAAQSNQTS